MSVLLSITLHRPAELEADLRSRGLRYSDRWRFDTDGTRRLTLREIWVAIQWLPHDAALVLAANEGKPRWSYTEYLLADLFAVFTRQQHPWRPDTAAQQRRSAARTNAERQARQRFAARRRALAASEDERG